MSSVLEPCLQLRKLNLRHQRELEIMLDCDDLWKNLMSIIPKTLYQEPTRCNLKMHKYSSEHFKIIENVSKMEGRSCTNILFEEWGTSGKVLPTLDHLLYLLTQAKLYRASEFVAKLIGKPMPSRPRTGPAARVNFDLSNLKEHTREVNGTIDSVAVPQSVNESMRPQITILMGFPNDVTQQNNDLPLTLPNDTTDSIESSSIEQDGNENETSVPNITLFQNSAPSAPIPNWPLISNNHSDTDPNIPDLSLIQGKVEHNDNSDPLSSISDNFLPNLSEFQNLNVSHTSSQKCSSPLPNLSLDTTLPHITWNDLLKATNDFNDLPYATEEPEGRFLGKGSFGSVYIGFGIREQPVAVKKLVLDTVDSNSMSIVTKQFCNEVQTLCKFQHDNLMQILGFSCDGCTYCLIYEYVSGGPLRKRLKNKENRLIWTDRVYIALGVSKAIAYLHTAFKDPVIHRDVKSDNILLDANNKPKLGDFGLVRNICHKNTSTITTSFGTSSYMPFEAFRGEVSDKLDTYSFGIVLLELLTGLPVFDKDRSETELIDYIREEYDNRLDKLDKCAGPWTANNINFGEELFQLSLKCTEEKKKRPTMVEVNRTISGLLEKIE